MFIALTAIDTTLIAPVGARHQKEAISPRILAEITAVTALKSTMRLKKHCEEISPYLPLHAHTLSPDKLLLYLVKLLPCTQQGHTPTPTTQKVLSNRICGFFLCLNTIAGGGIGRNREAAILELLLHRQWLVQCNMQLYSAFPELLGDLNSVKVCPSSK